MIRCVLLLSVFLMGSMTPLNAQKEPDYVVVEDMPMFPGGEKKMMAFIKKNVQYPMEDRDNGVEGVAFVQFVVNKKGRLRDIGIYVGAETKCTPAMAKEAIRVISMMPRWKPGKQQGKEVNVRFQIPIRFRLK